MPREPKRHHQNQDELKRIYADYIFESEQQARDFAALIVEPDWEVSVRYSRARARWQAVVKRDITPLYIQIQVWLVDLNKRAVRFAGERDGWGESR